MCWGAYLFPWNPGWAIINAWRNIRDKQLGVNWGLQKPLQPLSRDDRLLRLVSEARGSLSFRIDGCADRLGEGSLCFWDAWEQKMQTKWWPCDYNSSRGNYFGINSWIRFFPHRFCCKGTVFAPTPKRQIWGMIVSLVWNGYHPGSTTQIELERTTLQLARRTIDGARMLGISWNLGGSDDKLQVIIIIICCIFLASEVLLPTDDSRWGTTKTVVSFCKLIEMPGVWKVKKPMAKHGDTHSQPPGMFLKPCK